MQQSNVPHIRYSALRQYSLSLVLALIAKPLLRRVSSKDGICCGGYVQFGTGEGRQFSHLCGVIDMWRGETGFTDHNNQGQAMLGFVARRPLCFLLFCGRMLHHGRQKVLS